MGIKAKALQVMLNAVPLPVYVCPKLFVKIKHDLD